MPDRLSPVLIERPIGSNSIDPRFFNVSRSRSIEPSFVLVSTREREREKQRTLSSVDDLIFMTGTRVISRGDSFSFRCGPGI